MNVRDYRDKFVFGAVTITLALGTAYLFKYHSDANFGIWAGFVSTIISGYHWLVQRDDKTSDCGGSNGAS